MDLLLGRILATSAWTLAAVSLVVYSMTTGRRFFLGLVLPILYVAGAYAWLWYDAVNEVPTATAIAFFQPAQITLALSLAGVFAFRTYCVLKRGGLQDDT